MKYAKNEAKAHARETMRGIWAAALNPFDENLEMNEQGLRQNIRHWIDDLGIQGLFIAGTPQSSIMGCFGHQNGPQHR